MALIVSRSSDDMIDAFIQAFRRPSFDRSLTARMKDFERRRDAAYARECRRHGCAPGDFDGLARMLEAKGRYRRRAGESAKMFCTRYLVRTNPAWDDRSKSLSDCLGGPGNPRRGISDEDYRAVVRLLRRHPKIGIENACREIIISRATGDEFPPWEAAKAMMSAYIRRRKKLAK